MLSTNFRNPASTAGCANSSQKMSISCFSSSYGIGLMNFLAATAVRRSNLPSCAAVPRATRNASPSRDHLAHQSNLLRFGRIEASAGKQQVAHNGIAQIALQARNSAEAGDQSQAQFGKTEARHLVGDDQVADQRQLESSAET